MSITRKIKPDDIRLIFTDNDGNIFKYKDNYYASQEIYTVQSHPEIHPQYAYRINKKVRLLSGTYADDDGILGFHKSKGWVIVAQVKDNLEITADDVWGVPESALIIDSNPISQKYTIYGENYMKKEEVYKGDWISVYSRETKTGHWEYVERNKEGRAAVIIGITPQNEIILIEQHRYPFNKTVIEFPAGLIDEGETPEQTAIRELKEETGCSGNVISVSPPVSSSAGLTTEMLYFVEVAITDIDGEQRLDDVEKIDCKLWDLNDNAILTRLEEYAKKNDYILSSRLYAYFAGRRECLQ